jgi:hypothetical protein
MSITTDQLHLPETNQPPVLRAREITPWETPVAGGLLLQDLARLISRHVILPKWGAETLALWTLHTHVFHLRHVSTYIGLESPEKRCGKTTLLGVLSQLVNRPSSPLTSAPPPSSA